MIDGLKLYYKRLDLMQEYALYLWAFFVFFPQLNFLAYVFVSASLIKIITLQEYRDFKFSKDKLPYFFLLAFIFWNLISLLYSENLNEGLKQVEKKLPMLLIVGIGLLSKNKNFNFKKAIKFNFYGALCAVFLSFIYVTYLVFWTNHTINSLRIMDFIILFEHPLYIGMMLMMTIPFLVQKIAKTQVLVNKLCWGLSLGILLSLIYMTGLKTLFIMSLVILTIIGTILAKPRLYKTNLVIFLMILSFSAIVFFHYNDKIIIDMVRTSDTNPNIGSRCIIWSRTIDIIKDNFFIGVGIGDYEDKLLEAYKNNNDILALENKWNAHNQYLQAGLETGIVGVFLLVSFFISLLVTSRIDKILYAITFLGVFGSGFLIESVLSRNLGTFPVTFWVFIILSTIIRSKESEKDVYKSNELRFIDKNVFDSNFNLN